MTHLHRPEQFRCKPDAVLFDTDNTLYPYEPSHLKAFDAVRAKAMALFSISAEQFEQAYARARAETKARLGATSGAHSRLLYFQRLLELMGLGSQVLLALDLEQTYWRTFLTHATLFTGVKEFLDDLRVAGIPTAVVTDLTAQIQFRKIVYFGLDQYFDYIVTSEEAGFDKPHRAPFALAVEKMRPQGPCVWMIGDNAHNDILGARREIGAVTLQKIHAGVEKGRGAELPDASFSNYAELRVLLESLVAP
jgi:putative hydrolase of the HAD superfamily